MTDLTRAIFNDAGAARQHLENTRWPDGPWCPHCGEAEEIHRLEGKAHRIGLFNCRSCRKQFSVTVGTLFERSHVPLHKWMLATHLLAASKKGISSHQLHRMLGVSYKTAWFMTHRIREAMRIGSFEKPLGGGGGMVEADETYWSRDKTKKPKGQKKGRGWAHKEKILSLVERGGEVRSFHVPAVNAKTLKPILQAQIAKDAHLMTDEAKYYKKLGKGFASHESLCHSAGEYVRGDAHTNTLENYYSIFKRGMTGVYQHCSPHHLKRYLCEFDFRYNSRDLDDWERATLALKGIEGKRLTYRRIGAGTAR